MNLRLDKNDCYDARGGTEVAIRPKVLPTIAVVGREEIEMLVRKIVEEKEGDEMRARAKELKKRGEAALNEGGSSFNTHSELAKLCEINTQRQKVGST